MNEQQNNETNESGEKHTTTNDEANHESEHETADENVYANKHDAANKRKIRKKEKGLLHFVPTYYYYNVFLVIIRYFDNI